MRVETDAGHRVNLVFLAAATRGFEADCLEPFGCLDDRTPQRSSRGVVETSSFAPI